MSTVRKTHISPQKRAVKVIEEPHGVDWAQMDVFAEQRLEGNMLAVFPDGSGLTPVEMQALSRETNLSETSFILPRTAAVERKQGVAVRIFTTLEELPFAGHPTLSTASWFCSHHEQFHFAEEIRV